MCSNVYTRLREQEIAKSTKPFSAKGKSVKRCVCCQLADYACICPWRPSTESNVEFVLLMHRLELFKPTNTGRLIVDALDQTKAFIWSRTQPPAELDALLKDPDRECLLVFPCRPSETKPRKIINSMPATLKKMTLILLDGSWKQCSRMVALSRWLDDIPCLSLPDEYVRSYSVRDSGKADRFSTCEAAISCLNLAGENKPAQVLQHYYQVFNQHYLATRGCYRPEVGDSHKALVS